MSIIEHVLINYRWVFVCFFLLPVSVIYDVLSHVRNRIIFKLSSAPKLHNYKVKNVQKQVQLWNKSDQKVQMCTSRPGWQTMSFRRPAYKSTMFNVKVDLVDILEIDERERTVRLEPLVTVGQLTATLAPLGWTIPVLPELDDLTIGGLVMGTGVESSSHKYGLFQHICESFELVLSDGSVVTCSKNENTDLYYSVPWSYGTLGFLTAVKIRLIPAKKYVKLKYKAYSNIGIGLDKFKQASENKENEFVEGLMFNKDQMVVMTGVMVDEADENKINEIGKWHKPWFFLHVKDFIKVGEGIEYIPLRDYYHRHTRSIFWELQDIIPFGNNPIFRYLLGWAVPPKVSLLKLTQTEATKRLYENNHIIQDMLIPIEELKSAIELFENKVKVYPIWLCPFKLTNEPGLVHSRRNNEELYVDVGIYGVPKVKDFKPVETTRSIEEFVRNVKGFQMLYADTYMTEKEFREMFDHSLYDRVREELKCEKAFATVYGKVNRKVRL